MAFLSKRMWQFIAGIASLAASTSLASHTASQLRFIAFAIQNIQEQRLLANTANPARGSVEMQAHTDALLPSQEGALLGAPLPVMAGKKCGECGAHAVIRKDGCDYCTQCGHMGSCG